MPTQWQGAGLRAGAPAEGPIPGRDLLSPPPRSPGWGMLACTSFRGPELPEASAFCLVVRETRAQRGNLGNEARIQLKSARTPDSAPRRTAVGSLLYTQRAWNTPQPAQQTHAPSNDRETQRAPSPPAGGGRPELGWAGAERRSVAVISAARAWVQPSQQRCMGTWVFLRSTRRSQTCPWLTCFARSLCPKERTPAFFWWPAGFARGLARLKSSPPTQPPLRAPPHRWP